MRACQREAFGIDLPIVASPKTLKALVEVIENHAIHDAWPEVSSPAHGDIVTLTHSHNPHHLGVYLEIDGGGLLHTTEREGAMFSTLLQLKMLGFRGLRFHRYRGTAV